MLLRLVVAAALAARGASWSVKDALVAHDAADAAAHAAASLTRDPRVSATCDVRGNLGPCSVVVQATPGNDWLRAASCGRDDFREIRVGKTMRNRYRHVW